MAVTPKNYARAYYLATREKPKAEIIAAAERLQKMLRNHGAIRLLPQILAELPDAIADADADRRVTFESATPLSTATIAALLEAIGADPKETETVQKISPELIGGVKIKRMDSVIDATVRGQINKLKEALRRGK